MSEIGTKLRLTYYEASDGPRVMIFGPVDADFDSLQGLFRQLALRPGESVELHKQPFIAAFNDVRITLSCSTMLKGRHTAREGFRRTGPPEAPVFRWVRTCEHWDDLAELIDSSVKAVTPGHQYLNDCPTDDAIVVVSKGEYGDDVIGETE